MRFFMFHDYEDMMFMREYHAERKRERMEYMRYLERGMSGSSNTESEFSNKPKYDIPRWTINRDRGLNAPPDFL